MHVDSRSAISIVCCDTYSFFFFKIPAPKRERVAENEMITLARENEIS